MRKVVLTLIIVISIFLLMPDVGLAQTPEPIPTPVSALAPPADLTGWATLIVGLITIILFILGVPQKLVKYWYSQGLHEEQIKLLEGQIKLKEEQIAIKEEQRVLFEARLEDAERRSKINEEALAAEKLRLQQELEEARKQAGLPAEPLLREPVRLSAEDRDTLQKLLSRLERIETIAVATDSKALLSTAEEYFRLGNARYDVGQYAESVENYTKALGLKPDYPEAFNNRGVTYTRLGQYQRAIQDYDHALKIKPDYPMAFYNKACTYSLTNDVEQALELLQKAISRNKKKYLALAKTDADFANIRHLSAFKELVGG